MFDTVLSRLILVLAVLFLTFGSAGLYEVALQHMEQPQ